MIRVSAFVMLFPPLNLALVRDVVTSTAVMNLTSSCIEHSMTTITVNMTTLNTFIKKCMMTSTHGGMNLNTMKKRMNLVDFLSF